MHVLKVNWSVKTFALAKCNESDGKKSRIRRSKEERRSMVDSFIKEYQTSNNGKFPSLNLTHKEVGGSFYTVREIFREIIQENKVLGPATMDSEADAFSGNYVFYSHSREPQCHLLSSNVVHAVDYGQKEVLSIANNAQSMHDNIDITTSTGQSFGKFYEMVESSDVETMKSFTNSVHIPHFVHKGVGGQDEKFFDNNIYGDFADEEEAEKKVSEPKKTGSGKDQSRNSEIQGSKKLDDDSSKEDDSVVSYKDLCGSYKVFHKNVESNANSEAKLLETCSVSTLIEDQPSESSLNIDMSAGSEAHSMTGSLESDESNLSVEDVKLPSTLLSSDPPSSEEWTLHAVEERIETGTVMSIPPCRSNGDKKVSIQESDSISKVMSHESSISQHDVLDFETYDKKDATRDDLREQSVLSNSQTEEAELNAVNESICGDSSSSETNQISSQMAGETPAEPEKAANPFWVAIKSFVAAFVNFWVE